MSSRDATLRLFVAAYPPRESVERMLAVLGKQALASHRVVPVEQVHLTLCFLGDVEARDLDDVRESVERSAAGIAPFQLTPRRLRTLPERGRPRLVALETDAPPQILEIVRRLTTRLARRVREKPADRFLPHLTLCRFTHSASPRDIDVPVSLPGFAVSAIVLVRSRLSSEGALHSPVSTVELK